MAVLQNKIDFALVIAVNHANPNGDPLNGNRPRETYEGLGEISDVCLKRKIRNRMMDLGQNVFVQSDDRCNDGFKSLKDRADGCPAVKKAEKDKDAYAKAACETWLDVRSFGQVFAFKGKESKGDGVSVGVRGPVSIHPAFSVDPIDVDDIQITKSVNGTTGEKKSSDTMGMKHRVAFGVYTTFGSINCQLQKRPALQMKMQKSSKKRCAHCLKTIFPLPARMAVWRWFACIGGVITAKTDSILRQRSIAACMWS